MDKNNVLDDIFANDPFGLLEIKPTHSQARNADERLVATFQEINEFYEKHNREPEHNGGIKEHQLCSRLKGLREDLIKIEMLKPFDKFNLLDYKQKEINSLDDIFNDDSLDLLGGEDNSLFELKHVKAIEIDRADTDFVAKRKVCKDFSKYEHLFKACHQDLKNDKRKLTKFHENQIQEGAFFALNGILVYVKSLRNITVDKYGKRDGRTELIFENGTESNMLFRSLGKGLFQNGQGVTFTDGSLNTLFLEHYENITENDTESGYIYVLKSKSEKQTIREIANLFKIGYSNTPVEERIKNAIQEPTYLMADVHIVTTFKCYNMNPQKLEQLLHNFFGKVCLNIDIYDAKNNRHTPREWFMIPLNVIEEAIRLIISGSILEYRYDEINERLVLK